MGLSPLLHLSVKIKYYSTEIMSRIPWNEQHIFSISSQMVNCLMNKQGKSIFRKYVYSSEDKFLYLSWWKDSNMINLPLHDSLIPLGCGVSGFVSAVDRSYRLWQLDMEKRSVWIWAHSSFHHCHILHSYIACQQDKETCCCSLTEGAVLFTWLGTASFGNHTRGNGFYI